MATTIHPRMPYAWYASSPAHHKTKGQSKKESTTSPPDFGPRPNLVAGGRRAGQGGARNDSRQRGAASPCDSDSGFRLRLGQCSGRTPVGCRRLEIPLLKVVSLAAAHDGDLLFSGFDLVLGDGDRIGVVGPNGAGKTTLLRLLAGELRPADGSVTAGPGTRVGYVPQQMPDPDGTVAGFLHGGLGELAAVTWELRVLERRLAAGE